MWKAIKNYFWPEVKPTLEPVSTTTPVEVAELPLPTTKPVSVVIPTEPTPALKAFVSPVLTPVLKVILPASIGPAIVKASCAHEYTKKSQAWIRLPSKKTSFKLKNHSICNRCSEHKYWDIS